MKKTVILILLLSVRIHSKELITIVKERGHDREYRVGEQTFTNDFDGKNICVNFLQEKMRQETSVACEKAVFRTKITYILNPITVTSLLGGVGTGITGLIIQNSTVGYVGLGLLGLFMVVGLFQDHMNFKANEYYTEATSKYNYPPAVQSVLGFSQPNPINRMGFLQFTFKF